jgi:hypothetical protein
VPSISFYIPFDRRKKGIACKNNKLTEAMVFVDLPIAIAGS